MIANLRLHRKGTHIDDLWGLEKVYLSRVRIPAFIRVDVNYLAVTSVICSKTFGNSIHVYLEIGILPWSGPSIDLFFAQIVVVLSDFISAFST